jgi:hypothetical protein
MVHCIFSKLEQPSTSTQQVPFHDLTLEKSPGSLKIAREMVISKARKHGILTISQNPVLAAT